MVAVVSPFVILLSLFATSPQNTSNPNNRKRRRKQQPSISNSHDRNNNDGKKRIGRRRYSKSGDKIKTHDKRTGRSHSHDNHNYSKKVPKIDDGKQQDVHPMPELTTPSSLRPTYFTCRHTYEETLMNEIHRYVVKNTQNNSHKKYSEIDGTMTSSVVSSISPYPGLVRVEDEMNVLPLYYDPVYALQTIPNAVVVSGTSIKTIATSIFDALLGNEHGDREKLRSAPRGSLSIHALVPGMCKGQTKPIMLNRSEKIGEELAKMLRKGFQAARKKTPSTTNDENISLSRDFR